MRVTFSVTVGLEQLHSRARHTVQLVESLRSFEECLHIDWQQKLLPFACGEQCSAAELDCDVQHLQAAEWHQLAPCLRIRGKQSNLTNESGSQQSGATTSGGHTVPSEEVLGSHGFFHEASPCCSSWIAQSVNDWDPFKCALYNGLDLSDAGSCETELVHQDIGGTAWGHESAQLDVQPSVKATDQDRAQGANNFDLSGIAVMAPILHVHSGWQRTGVLSSGTEPKKPLAAWKHWSQLQDSFSSGRHEISVKTGAISTQQPRLQSLVSTTFPAQCLLETTMQRQVKRKTADIVNTRATGSSTPRGLSTATRLVLKR
ncbi:hypothetical protein WJX77_004928 [Trebouxia sp. C0004]